MCIRIVIPVVPVAGSLVCRAGFVRARRGLGKLRAAGVDKARTSCAMVAVELGRHAVRPITPSTIRPPFARYSHAVEVPANHRLLLASGQLGVGPDDHVPEEAGAQADLCFKAIGEILRQAGMNYADMVRINAFVSDRAYLAAYMEVRDRYVATPPPASTLMIVSGFARPEFKVEVEVIAAKAE
jgi:enamine deaminase RidA (YjgF/YER057c/UK114 family)